MSSARDEEIPSAAAPRLFPAVPRNLGEALRIPFDHLVYRLHERLAELGYPDIRPAHGTVFQHLPLTGARLTDIAEAAQLTKQTIGYLVDYLEERGYMVREPDPRDARARLVRYTEKGIALRRVVGGILRDLEAEWTRLLGEKKMARLRVLLADLVGALAREAAE